MTTKFLIFFFLVTQVALGFNKLAELSSNLSALNKRAKYLMPWHLKTRYKTDSQLLNLHLTHDSKYLVEGYKKNIVVREVSSGKIINNFIHNLEFQYNFNVVISPDDKYIIIRDQKTEYISAAGKYTTTHTFLFCNLKTGIVERKITLDNLYIGDFAISPDEKYLIIAGSIDNTIILYDLINEKIFNSLVGNSPLLITNDSKYLIFQIHNRPPSGIHTEVLIWNLTNLTLFKIIRGFAAVRMNLSPDSKYLVIGDLYKNVICDFESCREIEHRSIIYQPAISYDNQHIAAVTLGKTAFAITIWDFNTGKILNTMEYKNVVNVLFTNENNLIIGLQDKIEIWEKY